ncbi:hypothetical protein Clacol_000613 [Clathrus columnatus]|uniref:Supervillin n=1 Tax=Clathrus columnatus TaxID=1419009 RepID=A0AAV4ZWY1_9AGAM|nr:hypothetical protein Clacol_000613 [Clathrus columnatus]
MDPSRRHSALDIPKTNDVGLAEWASKIKAIQQEVDRDAEDEQRKLQEEINPEGIKDSAAEEKRDHQVNALDTLSDVSGRDPKQAISLAAFIGGRATGPRLNKLAPQVNSYDANLFDQTKREGPHPIFGKPLTGLPSKTRLLENKSIPMIANPNPVSTLSVSTVTAVPSDPIEDETQAHLAVSKPSLKKVNTDPVFTSSPSKSPDPLQSSNAMDMRGPTADSQSIPQRTFTDPKSKPAIPTKPSMVTKRSFDKPLTPNAQSKTEAPPVDGNTNILTQKLPPPPKQISLAEAIGGRGSGPRLTKSQSVVQEDQVRSVAGVSLSQGRALPGMTNLQSTRSLPNPVVSKPPEDPITTTRLVIPAIHLASSPVIESSPARVVRPSAPPVTTASPTPAPAFLRPIPTTEELHPSLSKLQGRGFVEQRVRATTVFSEPSHPESEQQTNSPHLRKRPSVLDRWQPGLSSQTPGSPTLKAPEQNREFHGVKLGTSPTSSATKTSGPINPAVTGIASSTYRELPGMKLGAVPPIGKSGSSGITEEPKVAPIRLPGMATKDTMDVLTKTSAVSPSNIPTPEEKIVSSQRASAVMASTSLNHPTRDRAKKPRKERNEHNTTNAWDAQQQKSEVSDSPTSANIITSSDPLPPHVGPKVLVSGLKPSLDNVIPVPTTAESPKSPSRHVRIPSTGQRATVMDVAQALIEHEQHILETPHDLDVEQQPDDLGPQDEEASRPDVKAMVAGWGRNFGGASSSERRKSGYERYSVATATTLPPLIEVQTPAETPQASLSRGINQTLAKVPSVRVIQERLQKLDIPQEEEADQTVELVQNLDDGSSNLNPPTEQKSQPAKQGEDEIIEIVFQEKLPPSFNPQQVMKENPFVPDANVRTISVEVNVISEGISKSISQEQNIFYDTEVIVVIYRSKQKTSELVSNEIWVWRGKNSNWEREARKATEIAERFNKNVTQCLQGSEPAMVLERIGQWKTQPCIVSIGYCFSLLGTLYVWHGRGSSEDERKVALTYAATLAQNSIRTVESEEGAEDEMFWMILGQNEYANAHHWKFRDKLDRLGARIYFIDSSKPKSPVQPLPSISARELQGGIFVIDCRLEIYVLIKADARGERTDIRLALFFAENEGEVPNHMNIVPLSKAMDDVHRREWPRSSLADPKFLPVGVDPSTIP